MIILDGASQGRTPGLLVAWSVVAGHGGTIDVASAVGKGSTFTIVLPKNASNGVRVRERHYYSEGRSGKQEGEPFASFVCHSPLP